MREKGDRRERGDRRDRGDRRKRGGVTGSLVGFLVLHQRYCVLLLRAESNFPQSSVPAVQDLRSSIGL